MKLNSLDHSNCKVKSDILTDLFSDYLKMSNLVFLKYLLY